MLDDRRYQIGNHNLPKSISQTGASSRGQGGAGRYCFDGTREQ